MITHTWMLSQFYRDPLHDWDVPVCWAYGGNYFCPRHPEPPETWALVYLDTTLQQVEAAKQDPRVFVCGKPYDTPPPKLLEVYKDWLDSKTNYIFLGQVLSKLSETEPGFSIGS